MAMADDDGFEALYRAEVASIVTTVVRITDHRPMAEEIVHDAFAKALVRWRRLRTYDRPGAWVRRVAIRDAVRAAERLRRTVPLPIDPEWTAPTAGPVDPGLVRAVRALPPRQRAAVVLHYLEDRATREVAELLGCSEATVRSHLHRARHALALVLIDPDDEGALDDAHR